MEINEISQIVHEANKAYCKVLGDLSQPCWEDSPQWQKDSCIKGIEAIQENKNLTPLQSHKNWMRLKISEGWKYGEIKNIDKKLHPCLVEYEELPLNQRMKDKLFLSIVICLLDD